MLFFFISLSFLGRSLHVDDGSKVTDEEWTHKFFLVPALSLGWLILFVFKGKLGSFDWRVFKQIGHSFLRHSDSPPPVFFPFRMLFFDPKRVQ